MIGNSNINDKAAHITGIFCFSASGYVLKPMLILQNYKKIPLDIQEFGEHAIFSSSPNGWITKNLFFGWCVCFVHQISKYRLELGFPKKSICTYG